MSVISEIRNESNGAQFRRADLHIHSFGEGGSYDVTDSTMTPENIVDTAIAENLHVISITDHNQIRNVNRALKHAEGKNILVVPGVELSTSQGHFLVYCQTYEKLERFYGKLDISSDRKSCSNTIPQCLKYAEEFGGFGICAHIESEAGFEKAHSKYDVFKQEILNSKNLLALEVTRADNSSWFTHSDENGDRKNCAMSRCKHLEHDDGTELAKVMSSDAHTLAALGRNANGNKKLTRIKMDSLTFDSLRLALIDSAARVRLEDLIPPSIPHFIGMKLEGGFLQNQVVHFSRNLTCIIGGRGAGKSTMLGSLRVASGNQLDNTIVDSEVWPDEITLVYEDEAGLQHTLTRSKLNEVSNNDPDGLTRISIESYGQGETAETIQHCDKDPTILLTFLDGFIDLAEMKQMDNELRNKLLENQTLIETLQQDINKIPDIEKAKTLADTQVAELKKQNASQVVELEEKLAKERRFRDELKTNLANLLTSINGGLANEELRKLTAEQDGSTLAVGNTEFDIVKSLVNDLATEVEKISTQLKTKITETNTKILEQLKIWIAKEKETQEEIENIRRGLEKQNIKLDMAFIRKVTKDATDFAAKLIELKKSVPKQQEAFKVRQSILKERRELKSKLFITRQAFATMMNKNLAAIVVDYYVTIRFHEGLLSDDFQELIKTAMGWRTSQVPKAGLIASQLSPIMLLDAMKRKDTSRLEQVVDNDSNQVFSKSDANTILEKMSEWDYKTKLELCNFEDLPEIKVSKKVESTNGRKSYPVKDFSKLSLGQQQSILLSILLFSKSKTPLIIDQPEDNLDSEFIYKTVVRSLRSIKEHRQVIIVTHNANIAVLGDAELIIPLRGASELSVIRDRGSIDTTETKDIVCTILEGSEKAFKRRQEVYGYN
jgi:hypothetical protein